MKRKKYKLINLLGVWRDKIVRLFLPTSQQISDAANHVYTDEELARLRKHIVSMRRDAAMERCTVGHWVANSYTNGKGENFYAKCYAQAGDLNRAFTLEQTADNLERIWLNLRNSRQQNYSLAA